MDEKLLRRKKPAGAKKKKKEREGREMKWKWDARFKRDRNIAAQLKETLLRGGTKWMQ